MNKSTKTWFKAVAFGSSIATMLAGSVGGGFLLGRYLDNRWRMQPWLEILFMLGGLVLSGCYVGITLKNMGKTDDEDKT